MLITSIAVITVLGLPVSHALSQCGGSDCVVYNTETQPVCKEVARVPTSDCRWVAGLDTNVDYEIEGGDIVAYKIRWSSGIWSEWLATGVNDIDERFNPATLYCRIPLRANSMRRVWAYFYDHNHKFIVCESAFQVAANEASPTTDGDRTVATNTSTGFTIFQYRSGSASVKIVDCTLIAYLVLLLTGLVGYT